MDRVTHYTDYCNTTEQKAIGRCVRIDRCVHTRSPSSRTEACLEQQSLHVTGARRLSGMVRSVVLAACLFAVVASCGNESSTGTSMRPSGADNSGSAVEHSGGAQGVDDKGEKHGPFVNRGENGEVVRRGSYRHGAEEGLFQYFGPNGEFAAQQWYQDGVLSGPSVCLHKSGFVESCGLFKQGKRNGVWLFFKDNGSVDTEKSGMYVEGRKVKELEASIH